MTLIEAAETGLRFKRSKWHVSIKLTMGAGDDLQFVWVDDLTVIPFSLEDLKAEDYVTNSITICSKCGTEQ